MNSIQKGLLVLMVGSVASAAFVGCDEDDTFDINSPDWLSSKIDSIANSKNNSSGDTTIIELSNTTVGATDNSAAWWTAFSDAVAIPSGKKLTFEFDNYGSGAENWNNWNVCVANNKSRDAEAYKEYFVLRSDAYGWGGKMADEGYAYDAEAISTNYAEVAGDNEQWAFFKEKMQGAHTVMEIQHVAAGYVYFTATMTAADGTKLVEEYHQTCSPAEDIYAFLVCDGSHFENLSAILTPASIVISESNPARMELSGYPSFLTLGDSAYYDGVKAKIYFEDGTTTEADTSELSFVSPDLSSLGSKTVTVIYNKTSKGNYSAPIYASYDILITDFKKIEVEVANTVKYFFPKEAESVPFIVPSAKVYGIGSDGDSTLLDNSLVKFSAVSPDGKYTVEYQGMKAACTAKVELGDYVQVGASDFSSGWWKVFSDDEQVRKGETWTKTVQLRSDNIENWHSLAVVLRTADKKDYAVVRTDNYGWGAGYMDIVTPECDWNFDTFKNNLDGAMYTIKVTNNGETIDVMLNVIDASGTAHFQNYKGVKTAGTEQVDADDVFVSLTCENAYLLIKK